MAEVSMHKDFADWYRAVSLTPQSETLQLRWKAVQAFTKDACRDDIADLARLFYALKPRRPEFLDAFRTAFKTADDTFPMRDNDPEMRVLAGSVLADIVTLSDDWSNAAALAIVSAGCRGQRKVPLSDIPQMAREYLQRTSGSLRNSIKSAPPVLGDFSQKLAQVKAAIQTNQLPQLNEPLGASLQLLVDAVQGLAKWASNAAREQELRSEESEVL